MIQEVRRRNREAGYQKWHLDHIVPLKNKKVRGLHTLANLQIILAKDTLSKGNRL